MTLVRPAAFVPSVAQVRFPGARTLGDHPRSARRWVLLVAVLAGLFGMHVLTAESTTGGHGALPTMTELVHASHGSSVGGHAVPLSSGSDVEHAAASTAPTEPVSAEPSGAGVRSAATVSAMASVVVTAQEQGGVPAGHAGLGGCILFLVIGGAVLLLMLLSGRAWPGGAGAPLAALTGWGRWRRRGPPGRDRPRVALCVIRV
jgi:hypothetical protein